MVSLWEDSSEIGCEIVIITMQLARKSKQINEYSSVNFAERETNYTYFLLVCTSFLQGDLCNKVREKQ